MSELLNRESRIIVGDIQIHSALELREGKAVRQGLDVAFSVERTRTREPNKAEITIWNLNGNNRARLQRLAKDARASVQAGYKGRIGEIFLGTIIDVRSTKERADWVTTIEAADGGRALRTARVNESFPAGTSVAKVLEKIAGRLGVGIGNASRAKLATAALRFGDRVASREFVQGTVASGSASDEFTRILSSCGLEWSVQGEEIQVLDRGGSLERPPVRLAAPSILSDGTGLIGSPEVGKDGIVKARALLNPDIVPGRLVEIESREVLRSLFRVVRASYVGNTAGQDWYVDIEAKERGA